MSYSKHCGSCCMYPVEIPVLCRYLNACMRSQRLRWTCNLSGPKFGNAGLKDNYNGLKLMFAHEVSRGLKDLELGSARLNGPCTWIHVIFITGAEFEEMSALHDFVRLAHLIIATLLQTSSQQAFGRQRRFE